MRSILDQLRITVATHGDWPAVVDQDGTMTTMLPLDSFFDVPATTTQTIPDTED